MNDRSVERIEEIRIRLERALRDALALVESLKAVGRAEETASHLTAVLVDLRRALSETGEALDGLGR